MVDKSEAEEGPSWTKRTHTECTMYKGLGRSWVEGY